MVVEDAAQATASAVVDCDSRNGGDGDTTNTDGSNSEREAIATERKSYEEALRYIDRCVNVVQGIDDVLVRARDHVSVDKEETVDAGGC